LRGLPRIGPVVAKRLTDSPARGAAKAGRWLVRKGWASSPREAAFHFFAWAPVPFSLHVALHGAVALWPDVVLPAAPAWPPPATALPTGAVGWPEAALAFLLAAQCGLAAAWCRRDDAARASGGVPPPPPLELRAMRWVAPAVALWVFAATGGDPALLLSPPVFAQLHAWTWIGAAAWLATCPPQEAPGSQGFAADRR